MARKKSGGGGGGAHDSGGAGRWLLTYADMITLLTAFFIMLYSMSVINLAKFQNLAVSVRSGFAGEVEGKGDSVINLGQQKSKLPTANLEGESAAMGRIAKQISDYVRTQGMQGNVKMHVEERGLVITLLTDKVLFLSGSSDMTDGAKKIIHFVSKSLQALPNQIRVEGHTCNLPIHNAKFYSNWELSTSRATNVIRYMVDHDGLSNDRLSAAGYADSRPVSPNDSEKHRVLNRRVDIVVMKALEASKEPQIKGIRNRSSDTVKRYRRMR